MEIKPGDACYLVFKAQAFASVPNESARTIDTVLNILTGTYWGEEEDGTFLFETEAGNGTGIVWVARHEDVLMMGVRCDTPRLARV